jgi:hypothetical protein
LEAVQFDELDLARQTHRRIEGLRVMDADGVTQRRQESSREQLHSLSLVKTTSARQELLEAVGVVLDGARPPTLGELEEWGRA